MCDILPVGVTSSEGAWLFNSGCDLQTVGVTHTVGVAFQQWVWLSNSGHDFPTVGVVFQQCKTQWRTVTNTDGQKWLKSWIIHESKEDQSLKQYMVFIKKLIYKGEFYNYCSLNHNWLIMVSSWTSMPSSLELIPHTEHKVYMLELSYVFVLTAELVLDKGSGTFNQ